jgi:predicted dehydrogenase
MINVAVAGLGKMGLSHLAMLNAHPDVHVSAVCDSSGYLLDVMSKYTGVETFSRYGDMLRNTELDAVVVATPSSLHAEMVRSALERDLHVFCEKPFCLDTHEGRQLAAMAAERGLVNQVGYHNRFVASFREVKALLDQKAIGDVSQVLAEAYGPVVLRPKGGTWRSHRAEGGGSLYDYAAHPIDLIVWFLGEPSRVGGSSLNRVFSKETDDQVLSTLYFASGAAAQVSVNWSDASVRKMTTKMTIWGSGGRIYADRQEIQVYLRDDIEPPPGYRTGWNVRYTTDLTPPVWFYLRGEEYSAQLDHFVRRVSGLETGTTSSFAEAAITDRVISAILHDDGVDRSEELMPVVDGKRPVKRRLLWRQAR